MRALLERSPDRESSSWPESRPGDRFDATEKRFGPIDLFCSSAGIGVGRSLDEPDEVWQKFREVNTMSQACAARHLIPKKTRPS